MREASFRLTPKYPKYVAGAKAVFGQFAYCSPDFWTPRLERGKYFRTV
jgi:hypothetical protein